MVYGSAVLRRRRRARLWHGPARSRRGCQDVSGWVRGQRCRLVHALRRRREFPATKLDGICGHDPRFGECGRKDHGLAGKDRAARSAGVRARTQIARRRRTCSRCLLGYGCHRDGHGSFENRAWLFAPSGELVADYAKQYLVPGFEARFKAGDEDVVRSILGARFGIAICKDMDFAQLGRAYSRLGVNVMVAPAYDFGSDAWSHASMAVLRGVEGGFSVVRPARHGLLIVSDRYGRVVDHKASADAPVSQSRSRSAARTRRDNALRAVRLLVRLAVRRFLRPRCAQLSNPV